MMKLQGMLKSGPASAVWLTVIRRIGKLAVSQTSSMNNVSFYKKQKLTENHQSGEIWQFGDLVFVCWF